MEGMRWGNLNRRCRIANLPGNGRPVAPFSITLGGLHGLVCVRPEPYLREKAAALRKIANGWSM